MAYPKMQFVNSELMTNMDNADEDFDQELNQVYVFAAFMRPGKQTYAMCVPEKEKNAGLTYFTHKTIIHKREEDIPLFIK